MTTTTNNHLTLIEKVGGIEKAKAIVEGAPTQDCFYDTYESLFYSKDHDHYWEWWDSDCKEWFECEFIVNQNEDGFIHLNDLRTAIGQYNEDHCEHEWNDLTSNGDKYRFLVCRHCDSTQSYLPLDESREFKVGDLVVDSTGFFDWLCKVDYLSSDGRVVMYKHDKSKNDTAYQTWPNVESVRHATPEEIKASRRLDHADNPSHLTKDAVDMVTDIRNHISPNTKVINHG